MHFSTGWYQWQWGIHKKRMKEVTTAILDRFEVSVRNIGAVPLFVYIPTSYEQAKYTGKVTRDEQFFLDYCSSHQIRSLSLCNPLHKLSKQIRIKQEGHWSAHENEAIALAIRNYLEKSDLLRKSQ